MEIKNVRPAHPDSYERLMHLAEMDAFFLPLSKSANQQLTNALAARRLERAIGVVYHPETERLSHYFDVSLPNQFDEWIWFDLVSAVTPLAAAGRTAAVPTEHALHDRRSALLAEMRDALDGVRARRAAIGAALENLRIQLLRVRAGIATPDDLGEEVDALRALGAATSSGAERAAPVSTVR